ncbi:MAG TPA: GNAT family N-acetyltransferase [Chloroflexia bacterium]|nr:GNAT family N-acetyltransferase [Chloroflexia bacterium]
MTTPTTAKQDLAFNLRLLTEADLPTFVEAGNEWATLEDVLDSVTLSEASEWFHSPLYHDVNVLAFALNDAGSEEKLIGVVSLTQQPGDDRAWCWLHVDPDYRLRGLGKALFAECLRRAEETGVKNILFTPSKNATLLIPFLQRRGWNIERYFWDMRLEADHPAEAATLPDGFTLRTFVRDQDEALLTHVRNVTFADHYGSVQRTVEEFTERTKEGWFHDDGVFFAFDGDEIAGFCMTSHDEREWERRGEKVGHIGLLGVMPAYRGRGLGRALLLVGVNYLRPFTPVVELGVEGKNDNALALYHSVGFHEYKGWANMVKE